jgi:hypothetical protein
VRVSDFFTQKLSATAISPSAPSAVAEEQATCRRGGGYREAPSNRLASAVRNTINARMSAIIMALTFPAAFVRTRPARPFVDTRVAAIRSS